MAALLPPSFALVPVVYFLAYPSVLIGMGIVTLVWIFDATMGESNEMAVDHITVAILFVAFLFASSLRIGTTAALLTIPLFAIVYTTEYALVQSSQLIRHGLSIEINRTDLPQVSNMINDLVNTAPAYIQMTLQPILGKLKTAVSLALFKKIDRSILIPPEVVEMPYRKLDALIGVPVRIVGSLASGIRISIPGGLHMLRLAWEGQGEIGLVWGAVVYASVACAFFALTMLLPPIRFSRTQFQSSFVDIINSLTGIIDPEASKPPSTTQSAELSPNSRESQETPIQKPQKPLTKNALGRASSLPLTHAVTSRCRKDDDSIVTLWLEMEDAKTSASLAIFEELLISPIGINLAIERLSLLRAAQKFLEGFYVSRSLHEPNATEVIPLLEVIKVLIAINPGARNNKAAEVLVREAQTRIRKLPKPHLKQSSILYRSIGNLRHAANSYAAKMTEGTWKGFFLSLGGFIAPFGILFVGLFKPFCDLFKYCCTVGSTRAPTVWNTTIEQKRRKPAALDADNERIYPSSNVQLILGDKDKFDTSVEPSVIAVKWKRLNTDRHWFWDHHAFWFVLRLAIGSTLLFALPLYCDKWRTLNLLGRPRHSPIRLIPDGVVNWEQMLSTKYAPWGCLGFLTTIVETPQGTFKRAILRATGVVLGSFSAFCLLRITTTNAWVHGVWLTLFDFIAVWLSCDRRDPTFGFHPSWGYAAQLFTYQQTIIASQAYLGQGDRDELVLARLVGQGVGIASAILVSTVIFPTRVNAAIRLHIRDALGCLHENIVTLALASDIEDNERWHEYADNQMERYQVHMTRCRQLIKDNSILEKAPFFRTSSWLIDIVGFCDKIGWTQSQIEVLSGLVDLSFLSAYSRLSAIAQIRVRQKPRVPEAVLAKVGEEALEDCRRTMLASIEDKKIRDLLMVNATLLADITKYDGRNANLQTEAAPPSAE